MTHLTDDAGREGSDQCLAALQLLHRHPGGLKAAEIGMLIGVFDAAALRAVLVALRRRGRVVCAGKGRAARWLTAHHGRMHGIHSTSDLDA